MAITIDGSANTIAGLAVGGLPDGTIDNGCMADDAIAIADLAATGTASSSTFLRGDNAWAAAGGGKVLQVTRATTENQYNPGANATWGVIAAPQASITPAATSSKIFVIVNAFALVNNPSNFGQMIQRSISGGADTDLEGFWSESGVANWVPMNCATIILDSPNTTSAVTYKIKLYANANYTNFRWNYDAGVAPEATASMTLVEIGA